MGLLKWLILQISNNKKKTTKIASYPILSGERMLLQTNTSGLLCSFISFVMFQH
jgi:hypothetical protein